MKKSAELELKLRVPDGETLENMEKDSLFDGCGFVSFELSSVYFDFEGGFGGDSRVSLRFRSENGEGHVTLKTGGKNVAGVSCCREWEVSAPSVEEGMALLSADAEAKEILAGAGRPVPGVRAAFLRRKTVCRAFGAEVEIALDSGWLGGEDNVFFEAEAEFLTGDPGAISEIGRYLSEKYSLEPEVRSKRARCEAYRLLHIDPANKN
ncbi:MAG: CYTH domain-containing protein [Clostridia bacterium]|nr:CYTH domain-containing protein [Clostridia bacterium]